MKVIPEFITFHVPVCTQSSPYTLRLGLINILIMKRILPWIGDEVCFGGSHIMGGGRGCVQASSHGRIVLPGSFLLDYIF